MRPSLRPDDCSSGSLGMKKSSFNNNRKGKSMIISVLNLKGGAGKTTLATNIAAKLAKDGKRTLLMDTDRQRSAMQWYEIRNRQDENLFVSSITEPTTLSKDLMKMEKMYDCMVIDGAPYIEYTTAIVATYSD